MAKGMGKGEESHEEDLSDMEWSSALGPDEAEERYPPVSTSKTWPQLLASLVCLLCFFVGLAIALFGIFIFLYSILTRSYIPAQAHLVKDLFFDYTDSTATASADFRQSLWGSSKTGVQSFPQGTKLTIWLELEAADAGGSVNTEMFQVLAQILTSEGQVAASVSRPCLLTSWSPLVQSIRSFIAAPAVLLGLWREHQILNVPLFSRYPDQADRPLQAFKAVLKAAGPGGQLPHLYSAKVHIRVALGFLGRIFYWLRPGRWNFFALMAISASAVVGGLVFSLISILIYVSMSPKAHAPPHSPPHSEDESEIEDGAPPSLSRDVSETELSDREHKDKREKAFLAGATLPDPQGAKSPGNDWMKGDATASAPQLSHREKSIWAMPAS